jgi:hypothetical protein
VTIRSTSTDNFGTPPVQLFQILNALEANAVDGFGRVMNTVFRRPGTYDVLLDVTDNAGNSSSAVTSIVVTKPVPQIASVTVPASLEIGAEAVAWVKLAGLRQLAGQSVQLGLGELRDPGTHTQKFVKAVSRTAQTDVCGLARVAFVPYAQQPGPKDLCVEVVGTTQCDATGASCDPGVVVCNPTGAATLVDTVPPTFMVISPESGFNEFDACTPITVEFSVFDEGSGVNPSSVTATIDGARVTLAGDCTNGDCRGTVTGLPPGVHTLLLTAADNLGHVATLRRDFEIQASPQTLDCISDSGICGGITSCEVRSFIDREIARAIASQTCGNLTDAREHLAELIHELTELRGRKVPLACADALIQSATWVITHVWGLRSQGRVQDEHRDRGDHREGGDDCEERHLRPGRSCPEGDDDGDDDDVRERHGHHHHGDDARDRGDTRGNRHHY